MRRASLLIAVSIGAAITVAVMVVAISAFRELSSLEIVLLQFFVLVLGLYGSYRFGQNSARASARDLIRPHARSAVRSLLGLRDSLRALSSRIEDYQYIEDYADEEPDYRLDVIQAIVEEQIPTSDSAIEDWRDIAPEDVAEIIQRWENQGANWENDDQN